MCVLVSITSNVPCRTFKITYREKSKDFLMFLNAVKVNTDVPRSDLIDEHIL